MQNTKREYRLTNTGCIFEFIFAADDDEAIAITENVAYDHKLALTILNDKGEKVATVLPGRGF